LTGAYELADGKGPEKRLGDLEGMPPLESAKRDGPEGLKPAVQEGKSSGKSTPLGKRAR